MVAGRDQQVVHFVRVIVRRLVYQLRAEQLLHIGLSGILSASDRSLNMGQLIILLFLHLLDLHLLNVLSYLFREQLSQLIPNLMPRVKLPGQLIRVIALANQNVLASPLADLDCQRQDFFFGEGAGGRGV